MTWAEIIAALAEILLPYLLELLENSPEDQAMAHLTKPGLLVRVGLRNKLRGKVLDDVVEFVIEKLKTMTPEERAELFAAAKANAAKRSGG